MVGKERAKSRDGRHDHNFFVALWFSIWEAAFMESGFQCASCGEWNTTTVDESAGSRQSYVEDCQVCCKPNILRIEYDTSFQEFFITAELE